MINNVHVKRLHTRLIARCDSAFQSEEMFFKNIYSKNEHMMCVDGRCMHRIVAMWHVFW